MKKQAIFTLFIMISSLLSAQWVTDNNYGFKINVPSNWQKESKMDGLDKVHDFVHPSNNIFLEVRAFKADGSMSSDIIAQVFEDQYLSSANRVAFEAYTLNNTPGKFAGYTMNVDGLEVGIAAFYAVKNGFGYVIWTMIETRLYNQYSAEGDAIMNTFTTFATAPIPPKAVTVQTSFKITNMKLGNQLTADYNILAQNESKSFKADDPEIYVIWDWEGKAAGKIMTIKWYCNGREIGESSQSYTLPNNTQGYGWASIKKPAANFNTGAYFAQIDFEGQKQRRIDFHVKKAASTPNSGIVIKPPSGNNTNPNNGNNSTNNTVTPPVTPRVTPSNQGGSDFVLNHSSFSMGEELKPGSKTDLLSTTNKFYPNSPEVISVFIWQGNGSGLEIKVNWDYYAPGASNKTHISSSTFQFPNTNGGGSNFSLSKPDAGWPEGQYWVEYYIDGGFVDEFKFEVVPGSSNAGTSSTSSSGWGTASGGAAANASASNSATSAKKVVLISAGAQSCYSFKSGKIHGDHLQGDIMVEPWCTEDAGVCGNWVLTQQSDMNAVTSAPASGYISDGKGFVDCQNMPANNVAVIKLKDGTYAKMMIVKTEFSKSQSQNPPCQHKTTILVEYPAF